MNIDISINLKGAENSIRDLIPIVLKDKFGDKWTEKCGITEERINIWLERRGQESKTADKRLLYYSDFYDLKTIILKNWETIFSKVFKERKRIEVFLSILEEYRNPDAHRRELLPHQKHLIIGITEEIRIMITKFHSKRETGDDCFPQIESIVDSLGNSYKVGDYICDTKMKLRPGDKLTFVVSATDPGGEELEYSISTKPGSWLSAESNPWQKSNTFDYIITEKNIAKRLSVALSIRSLRDYHAEAEGYDDSVQFFYSVLPNQ